MALLKSVGVGANVIIIQSLGVKNADFTIDFASGGYAKFTTGSGTLNLSLTDSGASSTIAKIFFIEITQGTTPRTVTYKASDANIISSGGLMSSGDSLPNSGGNAVDLFEVVWNGVKIVKINALFDEKAG